MKRIFTLLLVIGILLAMFSGCNSSEAKTGETATAQTEQTPEVQDRTPSPEPEKTPEGIPEDPNYNYPKGKYETDADGWPLNSYSYDGPISLTDEVFTYWTVCYTPEYIPEGGMGEVDFRKKEQEITGVNLEYIVISIIQRAENFNMLLAADDLPDIMNGASAVYPGTKTEAYESGYYANILDYREYAPNYFYFIKSHKNSDKNLYDTIFLNEQLITTFVSFEDEMGFNAVPLAVRGDWLEEFGYTADDIKTISDIEDFAHILQTEKDITYPFHVISGNLDLNQVFACFDTFTALSGGGLPMYPAPSIIDGKVVFSYSNDNAKEWISQINAWLDDGIMTPDFLNMGVYPNTGDMTIYDGSCGIANGPFDSLVEMEERASDPNARWVVVRRPLLTEEQVLHLGSPNGYITYGLTEISTKCDNIPLAVSFCDWRYSPEGSFIQSYGVEGTLWEYDDNGKVVSTEWAIYNPDGADFIFLQLIYAANRFIEHGLKITSSKYMFEGGERIPADAFMYRNVACDGAYEWPAGVSLSEEEAETFNRIGIDLDTYVSENILLFATREKPMSEWDEYIRTLESIGIHEAQAAYQSAYDRYLERVAARS
ncbi:MAG: hypothetical protein GX111_10710 [Clostridiales bacterium]|nr:hypothetical protein [Clostridiales bacterium]